MTTKLLVIFIFFNVTINAITDNELWRQFKISNRKTYKNLREEQLRFDIFQRNLRTIEQHNTKYENGEESYFLAINQFSDQTDDEFRKTHLSSIPTTVNTKYDGVFKPQNMTILPESIDWRNMKVVSSVKNQGDQCGSCWAFSALGALESQVGINHQIMEELSVQELIDCSTPYGNFGCLGGWPVNALSYIKEHGIATEESYPYQADGKDCRSSNSTRAKVKELEVHTLSSGREEILKEAIAFVGPISVAINGDLIKQYGGGIFDNSNCSKKVNHAVLAVGYGLTANQKFYVIKNSWGDTWGEQGYIRMTRNKDNQCGIANNATYPVILESE